MHKRFFHQPSAEHSGLVRLAMVLAGALLMVAGLFAVAALRWEAAILLPFAAVLLVAAWLARGQARQTRPVDLTPAAVRCVRQILRENKIPARQRLLVVITGVGPDEAGKPAFIYRVGFSADFDPQSDVLFESRGIPMAIYARDRDWLVGTEIDFREQNGQSGFFFINPNPAEKYTAAIADYRASTRR